MSEVDTKTLPTWDEAVDGLRDCGQLFHLRGWSVGTSSNYSAVVESEPIELAVTASGKDKGRLTVDDFVRVNEHGEAISKTAEKSSAETMLHCVLAQVGAGSILHTHSIWGTVLSDLFASQNAVRIEGYEMLKGMAGISTHDYAIDIEIFENTQDIPELAQRVKARLLDKENPLKHGFLIRKHGLYTWGDTIADARRHIEVLEFLFECVARRAQLLGEVPAVQSV